MRHCYSVCSRDITKNSENEAPPSWKSNVLFIMAATEACPSKSETNSKFILSAYGESLQGKTVL